MALGESASAVRAEIFGLLASARLAAFEWRSADAGRAVSHADKVILGGLAVRAFAQFERLQDRLVEAGVDPVEATRPFDETIRGFHERTRPADAAEALAKVYVADAILADLYLAIAGKTDAETRAIVRDSLADSGHTQLINESLRAAVRDDPRMAARLGLWTRRLAGEALSLVQMIIREHDVLARRAPGTDVIINREIGKHEARMRAIGLSD